MPQHKSAAKRMRTNAKSAARNRPRMTKMRGAIKTLRGATDKETASAGLKEVSSTLDRAAAKGTIHKNKASRLKSRLAKTVNSMGS